MEISYFSLKHLFLREKKSLSQLNCNLSGILRLIFTYKLSFVISPCKAATRTRSFHLQNADFTAQFLPVIQIGYYKSPGPSNFECSVHIRCDLKIQEI